MSGHPLCLDRGALLLAAFFVAKFDDVRAVVIHTAETPADQTVFAMMAAAYLSTETASGLVLSAARPEDERLELTEHYGALQERKELHTVWELAVKLG